jgi:hypothetical protein
MSSEGLVRILERALFDADFREKVQAGDLSALADLQLTEQDVQTLLGRDGDLAEHAQTAALLLRLTIARLTLTRAVVAPERDMSAGLGWETAPNSDKIKSLAVEVKGAPNPEERRGRLASLISEIEPKQTFEPVAKIAEPEFEKRAPDIYVVGLGINGFDQVTPETINALRKCQHVYYVSSSLGTEEFFKHNSIPSTDLFSCYEEGKHRSIAYQKMAEKVVAHAIEGGPIALAEYGHPTVFAYPPFIISKLCKIFDLKMKVLPAVSAMDCIFAELMIDPAHNGLQMYEATDLILRDRPLLSDVGALIWQVGAVETALYSSNAGKPERYGRLATHLIKYYPPTHVITAIYSSNHPLIRSQIYEFPLWALPDHAEVLHAGYTLYIPPAEMRKVSNYQVDQDSRSMSHLAGISKKVT